MTEEPFIHKYAYSNVKSNFIYHKDFAKIFLKLINKKGYLMLVEKANQFIILPKNIMEKSLKKYQKVNFQKKWT